MKQLDPAVRARRRLLLGLVLIGVLAGLAGLITGAQGFSVALFWQDLHGEQAALIIGQIRAPRTMGAALVGGLLGLGGAIAQGLFRNPLADPYLLGAGAGAAFGVVAVLAAASGVVGGAHMMSYLAQLGLVAAAFVGALLGVVLTLVLAQGASQPLRLLLAGVVVAVLLGALSDLLVVLSPEALRGRQSFMLGSTSFLGGSALLYLAVGLAGLLLMAWCYGRGLDALTLGEDSALSLGFDLARLRLVLVMVMSGATALAVSQAGLVAFVGLVAPHLVRRHAPGLHRAV